MKQWRDMAILCLALAAACLALLVTGCAGKPVIWPDPSMSTTVGTRDCHLKDITIRHMDPDVIDIIGRLTLGSPGETGTYLALASRETMIVFVPPDDPVLLGHEIDHLCAESAEEDAEIDARDGSRRHQ